MHALTVYAFFFAALIAEKRFSSVELFEKSDVENAFLCLLNKLEEFWNKKSLKSFQNVCLRDVRLSPTIKKEVEAAPSLSEIFNILTATVYCNWMEIRILQRMADVTEDPSASNLIEAFQKTVYSKKFIEVAQYVVKHHFHEDHVEKVKVKLNKHADRITVQGLVDYREKLEGIMQNPVCSTSCIDAKPGCLEISMVIPKYCYLHAFEMTKQSCNRLRQLHFQYVQIGSFPKIYAVNSIDILDKVPSIGKGSINVMFVHLIVCSIVHVLAY